jgi:hypothetical protein
MAKVTFQEQEHTTSELVIACYIASKMSKQTLQIKKKCVPPSH